MYGPKYRSHTSIFFINFYFIINLSKILDVRGLKFKLHTSIFIFFINFCLYYETDADAVYLYLSGVVQ